MPEGMSIGGEVTYLPGVYVTELPATSDERSNGQGIVAIVGEIPVLKQNTPMFVASSLDFQLMGPYDDMLSRIKTVALAPTSEDEVKITGCPGGFYLVNTMPNTQAQIAIVDADDEASLYLVSKLYGTRGNQTRVFIADRAGGGRRVEVSNNGFTEGFDLDDELDVITLDYDYEPGDGVVPGTPIRALGFDDTFDGSGVVSLEKDGVEIEVTFLRGFTEAVSGTSTHHSWEPDGPVYGALAVVVKSGAVLGGGAQTVKVKLVGINHLGVATTEILTFTPQAWPNFNADKTPDTPSAVTWQSLSWAAIYTDDDTYARYSSIPWTGQPSTGETAVIGTNTYQFRPAAGSLTDDLYIAVEIGVDAATTMANWRAAINATIVGNAHPTIFKTDGTTPALANGTANVNAALDLVHSQLNVRVAAAPGGTLDNASNPSIATTEALTNVGPWQYANTNASPAKHVVGGFEVSGSCFKPLQNDVKTAAAFIQFIAQFASKGFTASTGSVRASDIKIEDLDDLPKEAVPATVTAQQWTLYEAINRQSTLIGATYGSELPPVIDPDDGLVVLLTGGTEQASVDADWVNGFKSLILREVNTVVPLTNSLAKQLLLKSHINYMRGVGANTRSGFVGAAALESLSALRSRRNSLGFDHMRCVVDSLDILQYTGDIERVEPYWHALMAACANNANRKQPVSGCKPNARGAVRNASLMDNGGYEATNELIRSGLFTLKYLPEGAIEWARDVTTHAADNNKAYTEGPAVDSRDDSLRRVQSVLKKHVNYNSNTKTAGVIERALIQELDVQRDEGEIRSWRQETLKVTEYVDRYTVAYYYTPRFPLNFIEVQANVEVPRNPVAVTTV